MSIYIKLKIFFISIFVALLLLGFERLSGINYNYHVDTVTYLSDADLFYKILSDQPLSLFNNFYYIVVSLLNKNITLLIVLNILLFSHTNVILYEQLMDFNVTFYHKLVFLLVIFNPYKVHLAVHILKDTILIYFIVLSFVYSLKYSFFSLLLSYRSLIYNILFFNNFFLIIIMFGIIIIIANYPDVNERFFYLTNANFQFKDYDIIPTFMDIGQYGFLLRGVVWPLLYLTGLFAIISPHPLFIVIAVGLIINLIYIRFFLGKKIFSIKIYFIMGLLACIIPGFTTYFRYAFPIIVLMPLILVKR